MEPIKRNDTGAAVEDVQTRLARIGHLPEDAITGTFDDATAAALADFLAASALPPSEDVTEKVWAALMDATYNLGDRTLYLRMPYFHGHDVLELQQALGALGFFYGTRDAIFGAHTEEALRRFQLNLGLPSDGIAGAYTYAALRNLAHSWVGKEATHGPCAIWASPRRRRAGTQRRVPVRHRRVLPGRGLTHVERGPGHQSRLQDYQRRRALGTAGRVHDARARAAECDGRRGRVPLVSYAEEDTLGLRLASAVDVARDASWPRVSVLLPGTMWLEAARSAPPSTTPSRCSTPSAPPCRSRRQVTSCGSLSIALVGTIAIGDAAFSDYPD